MKANLLIQLGSAQRMEILDAVKRANGLTVGELADRFGMSYMGIKSHCTALEKSGFLDHWRRPRPAGRPEFVYRLTKKGQELFPNENVEWLERLLDAAIHIYGAAAAEKLLFTLYQELARTIAPKLSAEGIVARCEQLAALRSKEGCMLAVRKENDSVSLLEDHHPLRGLETRYPILVRLEKELIDRLIGVPSAREVEQNGELRRVIFRFPIGD